MGDIVASDQLRRIGADQENIFRSLAPGFIHVWFVSGEDIDDAEILRQGASDLTATEVARSAKFAKPEDLHRFIVGRWMLRLLLGTYSLVDPRKITFVINQDGRPELTGLNRSHIHFSLSHTDGLVACALTSGTAIGLDTERIRPSRCDMEVACNYFSIAACRDIFDASEGSQPERFFEYWVLMEACAKARGNGLAHPAAGSFIIENADRSRIRFVPLKTNDETAWNFWLLEPATEYRMAVALAGQPSGSPVVRRLRANGSSNIICRTVAASVTFG